MLQMHLPCAIASPQQLLVACIAASMRHVIVCSGQVGRTTSLQPEIMCMALSCSSSKSIIEKKLRPALPHQMQTLKSGIEQPYSASCSSQQQTLMSCGKASTLSAGALKPLPRAQLPPTPSGAWPTAMQRQMLVACRRVLALQRHPGVDGSEGGRALAVLADARVLIPPHLPSQPRPAAAAAV